MSQTLQPLLADAQRAGIYRLPDAAAARGALRTAAEALGYGWLQADLRNAKEIAAALRQLGTDLKLPDWYGANYDALADCLADLSWQPAAGYVLLIEGAEALRANDAGAYATLNAVLSNVIDDWRQENVAFWVVYDLRSDALPALPTPAKG